MDLPNCSPSEAEAHLSRRGQRRVPRVHLLVVVVHGPVRRGALHVAVAKRDHRRAVPQRVLRRAVREPHRPPAVHEPLLHAPVGVLNRAGAAVGVHQRRGAARGAAAATVQAARGRRRVRANAVCRPGECAGEEGGGAAAAGEGGRRRARAARDAKALHAQHAA